MGLTHPPRQLGGGIRPHAIGPEPVIPGANRLVRTEVGRERSPGAARMLQVETAVHHLAHIGGENKVAGEQGFDNIPFRVRQVARIASPISLVFLTVFVCPHLDLLSTAFNSRQGKSVKQALRACLTISSSSIPKLSCAHCQLLLIYQEGSSTPSTVCT